MRAIPTLELLEDRLALSSYFVSATGSDANAGSLDQPFHTIQHALDLAVAGDTISVRGGVYREKIHFPTSGNADDGPIVLQAHADELPILNGTNVRGQNMVLLENVSYVKLIGFEIKNNRGVRDGSGVRILGAGSHLEIRDNHIHEMRGVSAMGITVYGTSESTAISDLIIDGNEIHHCKAAPSETLTLNGNVTAFAVTNNVVHDINNIGIDIIGGETDINPSQVARNGVVSGNVVYRARSSYGGGFAAGIYIDGARDIIVENNISYKNDLGLEVGAENAGTVTSGVIVRNNLIYLNDKAGLVFGGFAAEVGRVEDSFFYNNTLYRNDTFNRGFGQLWIQYASDNVVTNNVFVTSGRRELLHSDAGNQNNVVDYNLWFAPRGTNDTSFTWNGQNYSSFGDYQSATGQDAHSLFGDPLFVDVVLRDFHLLAGSPAIDAGSDTAGWFAALDFEGTSRPQGARPDIGALEFRTP